MHGKARPQVLGVFSQCYHWVKLFNDGLGRLAGASDGYLGEGWGCSHQKREGGVHLRGGGEAGWSPVGVLVGGGGRRQGLSGRQS